MDRCNKKRKRAESISKSSLANTSSSPTAAQGSSTVEPTTDSEPPDCQEELCTNEDVMIPQAIYSELKVQHGQLLTECNNLHTKCSTLEEENEQLKEALG